MQSSDRIVSNDSKSRLIQNKIESCVENLLQLVGVQRTLDFVHEIYQRLPTDGNRAQLEPLSNFVHNGELDDNGDTSMMDGDAKTPTTPRILMTGADDADVEITTGENKVVEVVNPAETNVDGQSTNISDAVASTPTVGRDQEETIGQATPRSVKMAAEQTRAQIKDNFEHAPKTLDWIKNMPTVKKARASVVAKQGDPERPAATHANVKDVSEPRNESVDVRQYILHEGEKVFFTEDELEKVNSVLYIRKVDRLIPFIENEIFHTAA